MLAATESPSVPGAAGVQPARRRSVVRPLASCANGSSLAGVIAESPAGGDVLTTVAARDADPLTTAVNALNAVVHSALPIIPLARQLALSFTGETTPDCRHLVTPLFRFRAMPVRCRRWSPRRPTSRRTVPGLR